MSDDMATKPSGTATTARVSSLRQRLNPRREDPKSFVELGTNALQTVVGYARQQIVDPLRSLGKFIGFGMAGAVITGVGLVLVLFGLLRLLQTESRDLVGGATQGGRWLSFAPYLIVIIVGAAILGFVFSRITKDNARKQVR